MSDPSLASPGRVLKLAFEIDDAGPAVTESVRRMMESNDLADLLRILHDAPPECRAAEVAWKSLESPTTIRQILEVPNPDFEALDMLTSRLGQAALEPLLATLANTSSRTTRSSIYSRLAAFGPVVGPRVVRHLADDRWFVRRNMLALLGELSELPERWSPSSLADDANPAVRREALKLCLNRPQDRDMAVTRLLEEEDPRSMALGLAAAQDGAPAGTVPLLLHLAETEDGRTEHRVMAIRALATAGAKTAIEPLLRMVDIRRGPRRLTAGPKLAEKSPVLLAALATLYEIGYEDPRARRVLDIATRSGDPQIRDASKGLSAS